ncbi:hypothetical protein T484DRAFT_1648741, partial [Baffinella frigidus]
MDGLATVCAACTAEKYTQSTSNDFCISCAANTYGTVGASRSANDCQACPVGHVSEMGSSSCNCGTGYGGNMCAQCPPGTSKGVTGNYQCTPCPVNTYSGAAQATCTPC